MSEDGSKAKNTRRDFLKMAVVGAPVAAAATVVGETAVAEGAETRGEGLRKTAHVNAYLESARF